MTTFAEMTHEKRTQCIGMWAHVRILDTDMNGIIEHVSRKKVCLIIPKYKSKQQFPLNHITLRPDLPRAWDADGEPPTGDWEYAEYLSHHQGMSGVYGHQRRWMGEWERA